MDASLSCDIGAWDALGFMSLLIGVVAGLVLLIWGGVREARRRDRTGLALMLAGAIGLALVWEALRFLDAVSTAARFGCA
jgi:hypothetical protein